MIKKEIEIDGRKVPFRASAAIPRLYRAKFQRDIFRDMERISDSVKKKGGEETGSGIEGKVLELFEDVSYIMAKHADPSQPDTPEEWLDQFETFSIYQVMPELLDLWNLNTVKDVQAKKNQNQLTGK